MKTAYATKHSLRQIARLLDALKDGPMTCQQMAAKLHLSVHSMQNYTAHLRRESPRRIFIVDWGPASGRRPPIYALGDGVDMPEPPHSTVAERFAALKKDDVAYRKSLARRRAYRASQRSKSRPQTWLSALMPVSAGKSDCSRNAR